MVKTSRNLFCIMLFLTLTAWTSSALAAPVPEAVMPKRKFAFEPVLEGDPVVHEFTLTNKGDAPLEIIKIDND